MNKGTIACCFFTLFLFTNCAAQKEVVSKPNSGNLDIILNSDIRANLLVDDKTVEISGRTSMNIKSSKEGLEKGEVYLTGMNNAFFQVPQQPLAGEYKVADQLGFLGSSMKSGSRSRLKINKKRTHIYGRVPVYLDASFLNELSSPLDEKEKGHVYTTPVIEAVCEINLRLEKPLEAEENRITSIPASIETKIVSKGFRHATYEFPEIALEYRQDLIQIELVVAWLWRAGQKLCLQPVFLSRIRSFPVRSWPMLYYFLESTGDGFSFGKPQLDKEWNKVNIRFEYREPIYKFAPSYFLFDESESSGLRNLVNEDDCIEIFFVDEMVDTLRAQWGGGATYGSGTASSKIISSDENADFGVDFTHLAHEVGHVLGLLHPWDDPRTSAQPADTGTLMCGSGFGNDNPTINSVNNGDMVSNPLLQFAWIFKTHSPDCTDSSDCGACP